MKSTAFLNVFCFLWGLGTLLAQNSGSTLLADNLSHVYVVTDEMIVKYGDCGEKRSVFSYRNAGPITSADVSDPLKILVFFKDFSQIMYLDNNLAVSQGPLYLQSLNILQPLLVCSSSDKGFWVYDAHNFSLHKIDHFFQKQFDVQNITESLLITPSLIDMFEYERELYLYDENSGFYIFDNFGTYVKTLHFPNISYYKILGKKLFMGNGTRVSVYDLRTHTEQSIELPDDNYISLAFSSKHIFLLQEDGQSFKKISY